MTDTENKTGQSVDDGKARVFPCDGCGADLKFNIGQQELKCPFCSFQKSLEFSEDASVDEQDFGTMIARMTELHDKGREQSEGQSEIGCDSCGGTVVFQGSLTSSECPYCGSPIQLNDVHDAEDRVPVDGVLPFLIEHDEAKTNLATWVNSRWFAPNDFKQRGVNGKFNGVYMPYWTFDSLTFTRWSGQRGDHYYETERDGDEEKRVRKTRWSHVSGSFQLFFDDVLVLASEGLPKRLMEELEPWPLQEVVPFSQEILAGYYARTYEVELEPGFSGARDRMDGWIRAEVEDRIGGDEQRINSQRTQHSAVTFKHLLLPVYLLAYRFSDKSYQVMVNAATGEVQGERPYSWVKITLAVLAVAAVVTTIVLLSQ
jgi:hypothetical protein